MKKLTRKQVEKIMADLYWQGWRDGQDCKPGKQIQTGAAYVSIEAAVIRVCGVARAKRKSGGEARK